MTQLIFLDREAPVFPPTHCALDEPNGLLAAGGNLLPSTLLNAYQQGIFPWFNDDQPILWWSPSPRMVLKPHEAHFSRSLKKFARKKHYTVEIDKRFQEVMIQCALAERPDQDGTWINDDMIDAYLQLHEQGHAHSIEVLQDGTLIGGLYGISIGLAFFGESMFSHRSNASKIGFASLCQQLTQWGFTLIDCQIHTDYLESFGANEVSRSEFESRLKQSTRESAISNWPKNWTLGEYGFDGS